MTGTLNDMSQSSINLPPDIVGKKFGVRAYAFLIDIIIFILTNNFVSLVFTIILAVFYFLAEFLLKQKWNIDWTHSQILQWLRITIEFILYFAIFEWRYGRTPGKAILKMSVVKYDGNLCSFKQSITRSLYRLIDGLLFGFVAYIQMKHPLYQRLGDLKSSTLVVNANDTIIKESPKEQNLISATLLYMFVSLLSLIAYDLEIYIRNVF